MDITGSQPKSNCWCCILSVHTGTLTQNHSVLSAHTDKTREVRLPRHYIIFIISLNYHAD